MQQRNHRRSISLLLLWKCFLLTCLTLWTLPTFFKNKKKRLKNKKNAKNVNKSDQNKKKRKNFFHIYVVRQPRCSAWCMLLLLEEMFRKLCLACWSVVSLCLSVTVQPLAIQQQYVHNFASRWPGFIKQVINFEKSKSMLIWDIGQSLKIAFTITFVLIVGHHSVASSDYWWWSGMKREH